MKAAAASVRTSGEDGRAKAAATPLGGRATRRSPRRRAMRRSSSSTATSSPTAPITRVPKSIRRARRQGRRRDRRLRQYPAPPLGRPSSRAPCSSAGTRSTRRTGGRGFRALPGRPRVRREIVEQLDVLPEFVAACGFANAKAPATRPTISSPPRSRAEERRGGSALVASGDRDAFQLASERDDHRPPGPRRRDGAHRSGRGARALRRRARQVPDFIALRGDPSDKIARRARRGAEGRGERCSRNTRRSRRRSPTAASPARPRSSASIAASRRWTPRRRSRRSPDQTPDLGQGRGARARLGAQGARRPARRARLTLVTPRTRARNGPV